MRGTLCGCVFFSVFVRLTPSLLVIRLKLHIFITLSSRTAHTQVNARVISQTGWKPLTVYIDGAHE